LMSEPRTIVYFRNGIGNFIMMTPAIRALAERDPSGKVDLCFCDDWTDSRMPAVRDIAEQWELIDRVVTYPKEVMPREYDLYFWVHHTEGGKALDFFMAKQKPLWHLQRWGDTHEIDYYMEHVRRLGYNDLAPEQYVPIAKKGPEISSAVDVVALGNGAFVSKMWDKKRWPHFNSLAETLKRYLGCTIVLVGSGKELKEVDRQYVDYDFVGKLSITETAKVLSQVDLFITTDSGNMHIADALNVPMIALFGGTYLSKNRPVSKKAVVLRAGYPCQPCQGNEHFNSCSDYRCMRDLTIGEVVYSARKRLGRDV